MNDLKKTENETTVWRDGELISPFSGAILKRDSRHSLSDGKTRFPIIAEIPYLRADRDDLREKVLRKLDASDERGALMLLLRDQDDWAKTAAPTESDLKPLVAAQKITLREAMSCLQYGAVADYFAYRWSDPTFLSGLNLLENHLPPSARKVFELACGIGHYLREMNLRGIEATGADVVFSKLWLARKFVAPNAKLVCLDANYNLPFAEKTFDAAFCHDAFYFLPKKIHVAAELERVVSKAILIGHAHNADAENFSSGAAVSVDEYAALFKAATIYDDAELTNSLIENRPPNAQTIAQLKKTEAVSMATTKRNSTDSVKFSLPPANRRLRLNPLFETDAAEIANAPKYPSERYEKEYAALSDYLNLSAEDVSIAVRKRMTEGDWANDEKTIELVRRRIFLDLPENW